ncbi:MAG: Gfo/Idh/MocA family oxidoreductase [DPANN group archaeon]|nr:Gfo/Idh/MocA family oxidoreductase [DPANN group archaeon]
MRVAVIGVGRMGRHHARIYSQLAELAAVSDVDEENGKQIASEFKCKYYKNYLEMLDTEKPSAVSVVVPTPLHREVALEVIKRKINLLVEKPIATNLNDAREIINAAKENNVKLMVGHVERFNPAIIKLKELISANALGDISSIIARRVGVAGSPITSYENLMIDLAIHDVDIINHILGRLPTGKTCLKGKAINNRDDYADILLSYGKTNAFIQVNWITPVKIRTLHITGSSGYAELDYINLSLKFYKLAKPSGYANYQEFLTKFGQPDITEIEIKKEEPLKIELSEFLKSITMNTMPPMSGDEALKALEIVLSLNDSQN